MDAEELGKRGSPSVGSDMVPLSPSTTQKASHQDMDLGVEVSVNGTAGGLGVGAP